MICVVDKAATLKAFFKFAFTSACDQTRDSGQPCVFTIFGTVKPVKKIAVYPFGKF
jgi:hypothetical protein